MAKRISNPPPPVKDKPPYPLTVKQDDYLALLAQVEALRGAIEKWQATDDSRLLADALAATPQHHLATFKAERDALAAQVSRMSTFIKLSAAKWENCHEVYPTFWNLLRVANEAPQQHLAEIRAEAGLAGFVEGFTSSHNLSHGTDPKPLTMGALANQYAEQIRQGEVK